MPKKTQTLMLSALFFGILAPIAIMLMGELFLPLTWVYICIVTCFFIALILGTIHIKVSKTQIDINTEHGG